MSAAYELQDVIKEFRLGDSKIRILHGISFKVSVGESVAIIGPSGSGKSTILTLLGCLDIPSGGVLRVLGEEVSALDDERLSALRARGIGFVFQSFNLLPAYDAVSNVALGSVYSGVGSRGGRAAQLLQTVRLGHRLHHRPNMMSGGERQRVAIARALMNDPKILLADEPTGALDQKTGREILALLKEFNRQGKTLILVTHDPFIASQAERVLEIRDGRIHRERSGRSLGGQQ